MRRFRKMIDVSTTVVGTAIVFLAVILISDFNLQARIATVLVGVLMIEAGVWKLASPFLRSDRHFSDLREEVNGFIGRVRSLNEAALEARDTGTDEAWLRFRDITDGMHSSVDHMAELAGKAMGEEPTKAPPSPGAA